MKKVARLLCVAVLAITAGTNWAQVIFRDDFNDGALNQPFTQSGSAAPLTYTPYGGANESGGNLVLWPGGFGADVAGAIPNHSFTDTSIPLNTSGGFVVETRVDSFSQRSLGIFKPNNTVPTFPAPTYPIFNQPDGAHFGLSLSSSGSRDNVDVSVNVNGNPVSTALVPHAGGDPVLLIRLEVTGISGFTTFASANFRALVDGTEVYNQRLNFMDLSNNYIGLESSAEAQVDYLEISAVTEVPEPSACLPAGAIGLLLFILGRKFRPRPINQHYFA